MSEVSDALISEEGNLADAMFSLSRALRLLGNADAATPMGAVEAHGAALKESLDGLGSAIVEAAGNIADAIRSHVDAIDRQNKELQRIGDGVLNIQDALRERGAP